MSNRIDDNNQSSRLVERAIRIRAKEEQQKQVSNFKQKLETQVEQGANAKQAGLSSEVLKRYAEGEEMAKPATPATQESQGAGQMPKKLLKEEQSQKTRKQQDTKQAHQDKQAEKKHEKVALEIAVQRKSQQDQESAEFGGSGQGDFFQQAVNMGMAVQQAAPTESAHPVQVPEQALNEIIDKISVGVNQSGASEFVIDLKSNTLNGAQIQVSAQGKAVRLKFNGLDTNARQSVKMASAELRNRLLQKGLKLEQFEV